MNQLEYQMSDGTELAALLRAGEVSAGELMRTALDIASEYNDVLNALCFVQQKASLAIAAETTLVGPFGGIPFLLKDSGLASRRFPSSMGSRLFAGSFHKFDASLTRRFEDAGLIPFGRTSVPEFSMAPTTEAIRNGGPTRNPWNLAHSPGGSSGGAAAAVAAGIVPIAHGSDGGGSIRIPASCCGIFGLKPSRGLVPMMPRGEGWSGLAADGVLSRTVRDTAEALDAIAGYEPGAPYAAPAAGGYSRTLAQPFDRPLRIARWKGAWSALSVDSECAKAVDTTEQHLLSLGHEVVAVDLPAIDYTKFVEAHQRVLGANIVSTVNGAARAAGALRLELIEPALADGYRFGLTLTAEQYVLSIERFHRVGRQLEEHMKPYDLILTPTLTRPPARLGEFSTDTDFHTFRNKVAEYATFLAIINASGQPAASIPMHWTPNGLPVGVQLVGHFGHESDILRVAAQLEAVAPWCAKYSAVETVLRKGVGGPQSGHRAKPANPFK